MSREKSFLKDKIEVAAPCVSINVVYTSGSAIGGAVKEQATMQGEQRVAVVVTGSNYRCGWFGTYSAQRPH